MKALAIAAAAICGAVWCVAPAAAQEREASSGVDVRATLSARLAGSTVFTQPAVDEFPLQPGFRSVVYPTLKLSDRWTTTGAYQLYTRPYFYSSFSTPGYGSKGALLQGSVNYSRVSEKGTLLLRAGILSSAFGSFLLHYDDADNPVGDLPPGYGYYYAPVSILGLAAAQVDATRGRFDGRLQFANSSPANPRSIFAKDQYGNWAGGAGITLRQGLRIGGSASRGPYLSRNYKFFFPGEANPNTLPAHALGADAEWAFGHWNVDGEFARFTMPYAKIPIFREDIGYMEARRAFGPRWYAAARAGYSSSGFGGDTVSLETTAGIHTGRFSLVKLNYAMNHYSQGKIDADHTVSLQFVTLLHGARAFR